MEIVDKLMRYRPKCNRSVIPGLVLTHHPGMTNVYPSNFSLETISMPKPDSPL